MYTRYVMLLSGALWNMPRVPCIFCITCELLGKCVFEENTSGILIYSMVSHEKALHNYFIQCLILRKIYGNF